MASTAASTAAGAGSGAATGAAIGSVAGPWGTAIGAGVGALAGGIAGFFKGKSENDAAKRKQRAWEKMQRMLAEARVKADMQSRQLMRDAYTPSNEMLMQMNGGQGGVDLASMTDTSMYAPRAPTTPRPRGNPPSQGQK